MSDFSTEFAARLKEERARLGLSQAALGALGGVGKLAQMNYEKGARVPSVEYLHAIGQKGVDAWYLLTGGRSLERTTDTHLLAMCISAIDGVFMGTTDDRAALATLLYESVIGPPAERSPESIESKACAMLDGWNLARRLSGDR